MLLKELHGYQIRFDDRNCDLIKLWPKKHDLSAVMFKNNGYQEAHIHPEGWVSGVLYFEDNRRNFWKSGCN